ncbi:tyrosine-type recombinase/integrase [Domibacillus iocasae]|uniref:Integrase n=1 Tax=Domibacillus iocasae TaxID=1714016 RepID=A0A1E7DNH4_9BACI|nr:site-specific integrase [Domibacillus iocasae]OES44632.1 integrase [Domibacillus iocasae]
MASVKKIKANNKQGYKWLCVADGPLDPVTGKRKQISRRADKKQDAIDLVEKAIRILKEDGIDEKAIRNLPFEKVAWEWLETYAKGKVKESTVLLRHHQIKILLRYLAKVNINKVTPRMHQNLLNDLDDQGYVKNSVEGVHSTANMIFKYAIKEKMRKDNPCTGAVIPTKKLTVEEIENQTIEDKYLERDELFEFLEASNQHGLPGDVETFYLLAFSGMRSGELCALKWTDINFETNEIRITKTLYNPTNKMTEYKLTPPKTKGSIRTFDIDDSVIDLLRKHKVRQAKVKLATRHKHEDYHGRDFIFCHDNGYPFVQYNIIQRMNRLLKKTSIKKAATPHFFRHTHISMLAEAEIDMTTIMRRVGHDDMKTTMKIYTHVTDKMKKNAAQRIKNHFGSILNLTKSQEM